MKFDKGDLIAVRTVEDKRITAIVVSVYSNSQFVYCYSIDQDSYRLVYEKEVEFIIKKHFSPDFPIKDNMFDLDYSFYEAIACAFPYTPYSASMYCSKDSSHDDEE